MNKKQKLAMAHYDGVREGVALYAHWKDGVQYVGTCGTTLETAIMKLNKEEESRINQLSGTDNA